MKFAETPSIGYGFSRELVEIGHLSKPEDKSLALRGRYDLAVNYLVVWDGLQSELRDQLNLSPVRELLLDEQKEVYQKEKLEAELCRLKDKNQQWYERERASDYWAVANEMADVIVFLVAEMKLEGFSDGQVFDALVGRAHHNDRGLINEMIARTATLGMDLAEIIVLKTEVNMQHRDPALLGWVRSDGFMKRIRKNIGNVDSQIPHLGQGLLGGTVLSTIQAPKLYPKETPKIIWQDIDELMGGWQIAVLGAQADRDTQGIFSVC